MTELEKIEYAKSFIDKLANGINPLDDSPVAEGDVVNNIRLSRCFFYVSDILRQVIENGGISPVKSSRQKKNDFCLTPEERERLQLSDLPLTVSEIVNNLNSAVDLEKTKKISTTAITNWLLSLGLLETVTMPNGKNKRIPTSDGNGLGIFTEERTGQYGTYLTVLFSLNAQQFICDNIEAIIDYKNTESR